jgi:hypothetical protein
MRRRAGGGLLIFLLVPEAATQKHLEICQKSLNFSATPRFAKNSRPVPMQPPA